MDTDALMDSISADPLDHSVPSVQQLEFPTSLTRRPASRRTTWHLTHYSKRKSKARQSCRSLVALDCKRVHKLPARRMNIAKNPVSAVKFQVWKKKIDRKYEKIVERRMQHLLKLRRENQELKAFRLRFIEQCEALTKSTRAFRIAAERRQMMTILSIVAMIYGGSLSSNSLL